MKQRQTVAQNGWYDKATGLKRIKTNLRICLFYFPFAASLEKENAEEEDLCEVSIRYFILGVEKEGRRTGRRQEAGPGP
jgi:hypothetical protein